MFFIQTGIPHEILSILRIHTWGKTGVKRKYNPPCSKKKIGEALVPNAVGGPAKHIGHLERGGGGLSTSRAAVTKPRRGH